jgi:hypothetical protein
MTKKLIFGILGLLLTLSFLNCATPIKILTPGNIKNDIGGLPDLANCQFYISKNVLLTFVSDTRQTALTSTGVVQAERRTVRNTISIPSSLPGILQTKNSAGRTLDGYENWIDAEGVRKLDLYILFDKDDDNALIFQAFYDNVNDRFELYSNNVKYDGMDYIISYSEGEMPYLKYKILERSRAESSQRTARGRTIGS